MIATYIITFDAGQHGKSEWYSQETQIGQTEQDVVDAIIQGGHLPYRNVYRVALGEVTEDVTDAVAEQVFKYCIRNGWAISTKNKISTEAKDWLDWCGYDLPGAAE